MSRRGFDVALAVVLGPLWLACLAGHVRLVLADAIAWVPVYVQPAGSASEPARVTGFWVDSRPGEGSVAPGDALLSVGERPLLGATRSDFLAAVYAARARAPGEASVPAVVARHGAEPLDVRIPVREAPYPWRTLPLILGFGATGLVALLRGGGRPATRLFGLGALAYSFHWSLLLSESPALTRAGLAVFAAGGTFFMPLLLRTAQSFPASAAVTSPLARAAPWALAAFGPAAVSALVGWPLPGPLAFRLTLVLNAVFMASIVVLEVRAYRRADAGGRRQLRWVLFGVVAGLGPLLAAALLASARPALWWVYEPAMLATALLPPCVLVAIFRFRYLDIDRVITATAVYSILLVVLVTGILTLVPAAAQAVSGALGLAEGTSQVACSVLLAVPVVMLEPRLRPRIEALFLRERHALERALRDLRRALHRAENPEDAWGLLGGRLAEDLRLDRCVIYARADTGFAPVFAHGPGLPPGFDADGSLAGMLAEQHSPVDAAQWRRWVQRGLLREADAGVAEALGASVLLPLHRGDELEAVVCLGEKGSGDIYTPTDLTLLDGLLDRTAAELARFSAASLREAQEHLSEQLQSYVPQPVVDELRERAATLEAGEREVSVLFCDIRGYTSFSAGRSADEVFRTVNAYTGAVSQVVRDGGGAVIEFHGDGLLAVFGAPRSLEHKEEAAVRVAQEIVAAVEALEVATPQGTPVRLSVGVGIATGPAYVGDVQAVDRRIWTALGSTTNLAARLQALSRELEADIVVDALTRERAGAVAQDFEEREALEVRGYADPVDVALRPLRAAA